MPALSGSRSTMSGLYPTTVHMYASFPGAAVPLNTCSPSMKRGSHPFWHCTQLPRRTFTGTFCRASGPRYSSIRSSMSMLRRYATPTSLTQWTHFKLFSSTICTMRATTGTAKSLLPACTSPHTSSHSCPSGLAKTRTFPGTALARVPTSVTSLAKPKSCTSTREFFHGPAGGSSASHTTSSVTCTPAAPRTGDIRQRCSLHLYMNTFPSSVV
mmetsp:Transcript_12378/g.36799  ORF Transcript_12378/g.36799 Transcript_12378/m.36799 type:complete len:213 (-) Transcript_12378:147-785(-)